MKQLKAVEKRYNAPRTLRVAFEQTYKQPGRPPRTESGDLYLRRPSRMRWDYKRPAGKLFLIDGTHVFYYNPANGIVEKSKLKESDDVRAPLAFLIGRLDFERDFKEFRHRAEGSDRVVVAKPRSDKAPYDEVEFVITQGLDIRRLVINAPDHSTTAFQFSNLALNPPVADKLFRFEMPAGAELIEIHDPDTGRQ
jgi:outer membrane lipoprotein carrier protein